MTAFALETSERASRMHGLGSNLKYDEMLSMVSRNGADSMSETDLHRLARDSNFLIGEIRKILHQSCRYEINTQNVRGETPLHLAMETANYHSNPDIVIVFLKYGADIKITDQNLNTPFHCITRLSFVSLLVRANVCQYLPAISNKEYLKMRNIYGVLPIYLKMCFKQPIYIRPNSITAKTFLSATTDCFGETSLHRALRTLSIDMLIGMFDELMFLGADINAKNIAGETPLHVAGIGEKRKILLQKGANPSICDNRGRNSLHAFVANSDIANIEFLQQSVSKIRWEALVCKRDIFGRTPIYYCQVFKLTALIDKNSPSDVAWNRDRYGMVPQLFLEANGADRALPRHVIEVTAAEMNTVRKYKKSVKLYKDTKHSINADMEDVLKTIQKNFEKVTFTLTERVLSTSEAYNNALVCLSSDALNCPLRKLARYMCRQLRVCGFLKPKVLWRCVEAEVQAFICRLSEEIGKLDPLFESNAVLVGSAFERTKLDYPNEFDFNFDLKKFATLLEIHTSPVCPVGFMQLKRKMLPNEDIKDDYQQYFDKGGFLLTKRVNFHFKELLTKVLVDREFVQREGSIIEILYFEMNMTVSSVSKLTKTLLLRFNGEIGGTFIHYKISVDLAPTIHFKSWWPDDAIQNIDSSVKSLGCRLVFDQPHKKYPWIPYSKPFVRISFSAAESQLIRDSPPMARAAFMISKQIVKEYHSNHVLSSSKTCYTSYVLKTSLLYYLAANKNSLPMVFADSTEEVKSWIARIFHGATYFSLIGHVPTYFIPSFSRPVWDDERYMKEFHMMTHLCKNDFQKLFDLSSKECYAKALLRVVGAHLAHSQMLHWSLLDETEQKRAYFPCVNPLREKFDKSFITKNLHEMFHSEWSDIAYAD